jgi:hypothetical protein
MSTINVVRCVYPFALLSEGLEEPQPPISNRVKRDNEKKTNHDLTATRRPDDYIHHVATSVCSGFQAESKQREAREGDRAG